MHREEAERVSVFVMVFLLMGVLFRTEGVALALGGGGCAVRELAWFWEPFPTMYTLFRHYERRKKTNKQVFKFQERNKKHDVCARNSQNIWRDIVLSRKSSKTSAIRRSFMFNILAKPRIWVELLSKNFPGWATLQLYHTVYMMPILHRIRIFMVLIHSIWSEIFRSWATSHT